MGQLVLLACMADLATELTTQ